MIKVQERMKIAESRAWAVRGVVRNFQPKELGPALKSLIHLQFTFTHGRISVNFTNLSVNACSIQASCRQKRITDCTSHGAGDSIIFNILKTQNRTHRLLTGLEISGR